MSTFRILDTITYPMESGWCVVVSVPVNAAIAWLREVDPNFRFSNSGPTIQNVVEQGCSICSASGCTHYWTNKLAVVVALESTYAAALYNHDNKIILIRKSLV